MIKLQKSPASIIGVKLTNTPLGKSWWTEVRIDFNDAGAALPKLDSVFFGTNGDELHVGGNQHGVYRYAMWNPNPDLRRGFDHMWECHPTVVKRHISVELLRVVVCSRSHTGTAAWMERKALENLLARFGYDYTSL